MFKDTSKKGNRTTKMIKESMSDLMKMEMFNTLTRIQILRTTKFDSKQDKFKKIFFLHFIFHQNIIS